MDTNEHGRIFHTPSKDQAHQVAMRVLDHVHSVGELLSQDPSEKEYGKRLAQVYVVVFNHVLSGDPVLRWWP